MSYLSDRVIQGFNNGLMTGMVLIDLQKAFDTIDHKIFLEKLVYIGFSDKAISWFKSYLENRKFLVNVGQKFLRGATRIDTWPFDISSVCQ